MAEEEAGDDENKSNVGMVGVRRDHTHENHIHHYTLTFLITHREWNKLKGYVRSQLINCRGRIRQN